VKDVAARDRALLHLNEQLLRRALDAEESLARVLGGVDTAESATLFAAQERLRGSQQLLRAVFDSSLDAITLADDHGVLLDVNSAALTLFMLPREQVVGHNVSALVVSPTEGLAELRGRGQIRIRRADGTERVIEYSAVANVTPGVHLSVFRDITERVAAEEALRRNEALFRAVIEKSAEVISLTTIDGATRYLTPSAWRILGWGPDEIGDRTLRGQVIPEDRARIQTELERMIRTGARDMSMELRVMHRDGTIRWIESTGTNLLDDPDVNAVVGNYRDITARKHAEAAVRASHDQLEEAQTIAHVGSWSSGVGPGSAIEWSRECDRIYGIPEGTPITVAAFYAFVHPEDRERMHVTTRAALDDGALAEIEHRIVRPDGQIRRVHQRGLVVRDATGHAIRMIGTLQDITDQHAVLTALADSEQRYRRIVENTSEGVWMYDAADVTTFMNVRMAEILGWTVAEAVGNPIYTFMDAAHVEAARISAERRRQSIAERRDVELRRKDGTPVLVSIGSTPLFSAEGIFEAALCLVTDVSEQRRADETRAHLAAIVESSEDAIMSTALDGTVTSWNRGAERIYGYRADEMLGQSVFAIIPSDGAVIQHDILRRVAAGESVVQAECVRVRKDRSCVVVAVTVSPVRSAAGAVIGMSKIARDLTAVKTAEVAHHRVEEQFRQAQKMEAVGRLAGGVAHDFNNLLTVILSYSEFAIEDLKGGDPLRADLLEIKQAAQRAAVLTTQLLAFSRQQVLQPRVIDLNQVVDGMKVMFGRLLGEDVELGLVLHEGLGRVLADPGQIEQVVMNLAVNARDAMPDGGQLAIETSNIRLPADHVGELPAGDYVLLSVTDTGTGMDAATRARIFEPFFTTKAPGKGTGLGLSTVFGIVQQSGGYLDVHSEPGHGSTFKAYLPRTSQRVRASSATGHLPVLRGSETILLVEDEAQVRTVASAILRRNGYNVLETSNGGEAFLVSKQLAGTIHLLLTDVVMPRMSGRKLAEELVEQRPAMRVLFTSGYTDDTIIRHGVLEVGVAFLQKPFTPDMLLRRVRDVLDGAS
jgi:two-component system, cell cycle sensor histidine kinase and response regulator CckA